jgi:hypothetical protein
MVGRGLRKLFVLGVVAVALVIAGCGGDSDSSSSDSEAAGKQLSAAEYARRAEAICQKTSDQRTKAIEQLVKEHPPASTGSELPELMAQTAKPYFEEMVEELEEIAPPAGKQGNEYREWVEAVEVAVESIEEPEPAPLETSVSAHHVAKRAGLQKCSLL